jgi:predicted transcriptional regulator
MSTTKEEMKALVENQPEDSSPEQIVRELAFHIMIQRGLTDSDTGKIVSNQEMAHRIRSW